MNLELITNFFYERASKRITLKVRQSKLKYSQIYKPDHKQISRIINNKRNRNNPFLICDAVISNSYKDEETGTFIKCGLLETLDFKNVKEILWGTSEEINSYLFDLFILLWSEVSAENSPYNIDRELYLCDYIPYAKYHTYWDILFSPDNKYPAIAYGIDENTVISNIDPARDNALKYLYQKCSDEFKKIFWNFTEETLSFHKIDKVFKESFIEQLFIPMIKEYSPNASSLGLRVRDLINIDMSHSAPLIFNENENNDSYYRALINASSKYIVALENIQSKYQSE